MFLCVDHAFHGPHDPVKYDYYTRILLLMHECKCIGFFVRVRVLFMNMNRNLLVLCVCVVRPCISFRALAPPVLRSWKGASVV